MLTKGRSVHGYWRRVGLSVLAAQRYWYRYLILPIVDEISIGDFTALVDLFIYLCLILSICNRIDL